MPADTRSSSVIRSSAAVYGPIGYAVNAPRSSTSVPGSEVSRSIGRSAVTLPLNRSFSQNRLRLWRNTFTVRE